MKKQEIELKDAMQVLRKHLKQDADYWRQGWKSNIAMTIFDTFIEHGWDDSERKELHKICNESAERFLEILTT